MKKTLYSFASLLVMVLAVLSTASCGKKKFHVNGTLTNAKDSILYFEHNGLTGFSVVDSVKLGEDGSFSFKGDAAENPEFYRLRVAGQIINVAIDSTETVDVKASYPMMATQYTISGYENGKIKELALKQIDLQTRANAILNSGRADADSLVNGLINAYKTDVERNYIFREPMKAYAYFALFQYVVIGGQAQMIFNPSKDPRDIKVFGAVATQWDTYYPKSERGQNLHNIAIQGMKNQRIIDNSVMNQGIEASKVTDSGIIDIQLTDNKGRLRSLKELKGKVVMLDFHVFATGRQSAERIMQLRSLYNTYHSRGFEIYQVSLDQNEHFWKTETANLPWICVWDPDGLESVNLRNYNVQQVPTFFLIDKNNVLQKRDTQISNLDATIQSML